VRLSRRRATKTLPGDLTGLRFGRLVALHQRGYNKHGKQLWEVRCDCGTVKAIPRGYLVTGDTNSCGCLKADILRERASTHGKTNSSTYRVWGAMKTRCTNPNADSYRLYGGRGIRVCERWLSSFEDFLADMGEKPEGMSLERKNSDGNYEPDNCRWATSQEQANNTSRNRLMTHEGKTQTLVQWARELSIGESAIRNRLKRGWPLEKALTTPPGRNGGLKT
jgi:hypothetical protein